MTDWTRNPIERSRYLDGDLSPAERAAREAGLAADPAGRARVDADERLIEVIRLAGAAQAQPSEAFEIRVRNALAEDRAALAADRTDSRSGKLLHFGRGRLAAALAAAAVVVAGVVWATSDSVPTSVAAQREVLLAAETFRGAQRGDFAAGHSTGGTCDEGVASPLRYPLVVNGEAAVASCTPGGHDGTSVSVLRRDGDTKGTQGLVIVPWDGKSSATDVGYTVLGDVVVFDVAIGRAKYFLATRWDQVAGTPSCAACHGPTRADTPKRNPHVFIERKPETLPTGGR